MASIDSDSMHVLLPDYTQVIHISIPAMNEADFLPKTMQCIQNQRGLHSSIAVHTWICVNQPDHWWQDTAKLDVCINNRQTLEYLRTHPTKNLKVLDRSSTGKGWTGKDHGVGMARKVLMDSISEVAGENDLIVSMDADSYYPPGYLASVVEQFEQCPQAVALSNPYYHRLSGDERLDRAMLRYEIYMRHYAINMWRIGSPYSFTALGSAIALPMWAYRKIGGMTAKKSGEDFYLLQKLRKAGWIINHNWEKVYPGTRYSDRVFFGTGPALIKGSQGLWDSYPIYDHSLFDQVKQTYDLLPVLYDHEVKTPMDDFLKRQFRTGDIFGPLRKNAANREQFVKACHHKIDGLRVLQFLKSTQPILNHTGEENMLSFLEKHHPDAFGSAASDTNNKLQTLNFRTSPIALLDNLRTFLVQIESSYQKTNLEQ